MTTRDVLWYLVFTGFAVNYMIRINLNIAIVAMVKAKPKSTESINSGSECLREEALAELKNIEKELEIIENKHKMDISNITTNNTVQVRLNVF